MRRSLRTCLVGAISALALLSAGVTSSSATSRGSTPPPGSEQKNYAFNTSATQSTTDFGGTADRAVDGNPRSSFDSNSVSHTTLEDQPWWGTDLGSSKKLKKLVVRNRTDCCTERLNNFWVMASDRPFASDDLDKARHQRGVTAFRVATLDGPSAQFTLQRSARYIRVQLEGTGYLALAEVQAYGDEVVSPSGRAQNWVKDNPFGMFLHYNMSTYTNEQWADPATPASTFDPSGVDPDQWAKSMKSAGMTFGVLTAKHHDGFALWPTAYSAHDIANSPYKDGNGDIMREYVNAMHANGLKVGVYFSIWDRHEGDSTALIQNQLRELLTKYGQIDYLWFDGWGWKIPYSQIPYQPIRDMIRKTSPKTVVANNDHNGTLQTSDVIVYEVPVEGMPPATNARPTDGSDTLDTNQTWFHTTSTGAPRSAQDIVDNLNKATAGNALFLLNVGPAKDGRLPQDYTDRLDEIGALIRK